jgi:hypothetical protein
VEGSRSKWIGCFAITMHPHLRRIISYSSWGRSRKVQRQPTKSSGNIRRLTSCSRAVRPNKKLSPNMRNEQISKVPLDMEDRESLFACLQCCLFIFRPLAWTKCLTHRQRGFRNLTWDLRGMQRGQIEPIPRSFGSIAPS